MNESEKLIERLILLEKAIEDLKARIKLLEDDKLKQMGKDKPKQEPPPKWRNGKNQ